MLKKIVCENGIKYKVLGIPIKSVNWNDDTIKICILGLPIWKIKRTDERLKIYFAGIQLISVKNVLCKTVYTEPPKPIQKLSFKALELLNERRNVTYEDTSAHA